MTNPPPIVIGLEDDAALEALDHVCSPDNAPRILGGAYMSVVRAWEKGANREPFVDILDHCLTLYNLLTRIRFLAATKSLIDNNVPVTSENLGKSLATLTVEAESSRNKLLERMQAVKRIPPPGVTKH